MYNVSDIRHILGGKLFNEDFVEDKSGVKLIEIVGSSFICDESTIFGTRNEEYIAKEIEWYKSESLNVYDMENPPKIWQQIADKNGYINSNYGWMIYSEGNGNQYLKVLKELKNNPSSRRAEMIYTRPSMHLDYNRNGMSDFCCTLGVDYLIRDNKLYAVVKMRSNDGWAGFRNDYAWQQYIQSSLAFQLGLECGDIIWQPSSLHLYERQFYLVDHYLKTNEISISKDEYRLKYPNSEWC